MIKQRLNKARRVLEVQQDLQRLEEVRVAGLRSRQAEIAASREELVATLSNEAMPRQLLLDAIVRRLKSLSEEEVKVAKELERRSELLRQHASRAKCAERRSRDYEQQDAKARADKELQEVVDRVGRPGDASLR
jgi:DNA repair exonuclease SbcCD ATPase subunit